MPRDRAVSRTTGLAILAVAMLLALVTVLFLPVIQSLAYVLFVRTPALWYWLLVGGLVTLAVGLRTRSPDAIAVCLGATAVMALIVGPAMSGVYAHEHIVAQQSFEQVDQLPATSSEHVRVLPRAVADEYGQSSMQYPRYRLSESDITYHNGSYTWSYALIPDRFLVAWQGNQHGAFFVDMETQQKRVAVVEQDVQCGRGQLFTDSYAYKFNVDRLDVEHRDATTFVFEHENELHVAQSYVTHDWEWRWTPFPQPYVVPEYAGTQVIDSECTVQDVPASDVPDSEVLAGQNTYPYDLARFRMRAMQYQHGLWNKLFVGTDVPQIAETPGQGNSQPFTVPIQTASGDTELAYFIAAEPAGSGDGVYQVYTIDAQTGQIQYVEYDETQLGPQKAADFTRRENPRVNWQTGDGEDASGTMEVTEPIPVVRNDTLYWQVRVVPTDSAGISYSAFVNAETGRVTEVANDQEIYAFVGGQQIADNDRRQPSSAGTATETVVTIAVIEDGQVVETINVTQGQRVVISHGNTSTPTEGNDGR